MFGVSRLNQRVKCIVTPMHLAQTAWPLVGMPIEELA